VTVAVSAAPSQCRGVAIHSAREDRLRTGLYPPPAPDATGTITAASNSKNSIGGPVTIRLVGGGQGLELTIAGGDQSFPFCNDNDSARHYYCGA
jgi:hypothetical protein